ncbi:ABC transporter permease [Nonomuraea roseoviolacea subsp. roseoviolacea]|uniref:ABC-type nitrate/sulfonate/bicarbonate transport system permease component n=1 Tax=Nonomuraea roseoviolacea subsp. carminata TaxID=160689 RepID=A0ABT1JVH2_9ACTN|nr:ABC transporter permease [Nonomuraea roseoviolacea]MCP2345261.1 ABC-type nitrate/sulfonate/bicarbonate transport system permease component [Nonomuraea roseoviolacea subsp. carminata]
MIATLVRRLWLAPVLLACWELLARAQASPYLPAPTRIASWMYERWFSGPYVLTEEAVDNFVPSLVRVVGSWSVAVVAGVALGVAIGRMAWLSDYVDPLVEFGRAVPPPAMLPVFLVLFTMGTQVQVATIVFGVVWPILLNSIDGARNVDPLQLETAAVFGVPARLRLLRIILPSASPKIFAGLRLSVSLALILMVISELKGSTDGIGYLLSTASNNADMPGLWAGVVVLGVLGYALNSLFLMAERRVLTWHRGARRTA